jgi:hypothetical protein
MVDIIVQRAGGDSPGDDIVDPLTSTVAVALVRGRNALDAQASDKVPVTYTLLPQPGLQLGQLLELHDAQTGQSFKAKLLKIGLSKALAMGRMEITVERASDFSGGGA